MTIRDQFLLALGEALREAPADDPRFERAMQALLGESQEDLITAREACRRLSISLATWYRRRPPAVIEYGGVYRYRWEDVRRKFGMTEAQP